MYRVDHIAERGCIAELLQVTNYSTLYINVYNQCHASLYYLMNINESVDINLNSK